MMEAHFRVREPFHITGRGAVLTGDIVDGTLKLGMTLCCTLPSGANQELTVSAIESLSDMKRNHHWHGLMFRENPDVSTLRTAFPKDTIIGLREA
jgi:hypothetical protein